MHDRTTTVRLIEGREVAARAIAAVADLIPLDLIVTDERAIVLAANRSAQNAAVDGRCPRIAAGRLEAGGVSATERLRKAVRDAVMQCAPERPVVEALRLGTDSTGAPVNVAVAGFAIGGDGEAPIMVACVCASHASRQTYPAQAWLETFFGLTRAEARVASLLAGGASIEEAASVAGVGIATIRTHLSRALEKVGASRQAELVSRVLRSPALLNGRDPP